MKLRRKHQIAHTLRRKLQGWRVQSAGREGVSCNCPETSNRCGAQSCHQESGPQNEWTLGPKFLWKLGARITFFYGKIGLWFMIFHEEIGPPRPIFSGDQNYRARAIAELLGLDWATNSVYGCVGNLQCYDHPSHASVCKKIHMMSIWEKWFVDLIA